MNSILGHERWHRNTWIFGGGRKRHNVVSSNGQSYTNLWSFSILLSYTHLKTGCIVIKQNGFFFKLQKVMYLMETWKVWGKRTNEILWFQNKKQLSVLTWALGLIPVCSQWALALPTGYEAAPVQAPLCLPKTPAAFLAPSFLCPT